MSKLEHMQLQSHAIKVYDSQNAFHVLYSISKLCIIN